MTWSPPEPHDREALSATLIQILLFVENLNSLAIERLVNKPDERVYVANLAVSLRNGMAAGRIPRAKTCQWIEIFERVGHSFDISQHLVDHLAARLVRPRVARADDKSGQWSIESTINRARPLTLAPPLRLNVVLHRLRDRRIDFATRDVGFEVHGERRVIATPCDEPLNPIAVMEDFLVAILGVREDSAEHFIQHWLRQEFEIHYSAENKVLMHRVCEEFNRLLHRRTGAPARVTLGVDTAIEIIRGAFESSHSWRPPSDHLPSFYRQAVGTFLALRLCGLFRHQTSVIAEANLEGVEHNALHLRNCVSPLRRAESGFIRTRIFGALAGIPGLKTVFRGGLLPHVDEGRVFVVRGEAGCGKTVLALKMVADVAYRGRLGVYISAEESISSIADRLLSFGMLDPRMFDVIAGGPDLAEQIRMRRDHPSGRGLLVLCALGNRSSTSSTWDPTQIIEEVAIAAGNEGRWKWRAVVVDSLPALELYDRADGAVPSDPIRVRSALLHLVDLINRHRCWGLFISEAGSPHSDMLSYVADTVIELGFDADRLTRWLRIDKCRTQDYQFGEHHFRISESQGIRIYPSLSAVQSSLRRRTKATLSEMETIALPEAVKQIAATGSISIKSSVLIAGPDRTGKSNLMLHLLTTPQVRRDAKSKTTNGPSSVLVVTFRSSEQQYRQRIRSQRALTALWERIGTTQVRYFSPGRSLTTGQLVSEIRHLILRAQRASVPIERIAFDEVDSALSRIPDCAGDPMLWHTLNELTSSEAITTFFMLKTTPHDRWLEDQLRGSVDYVFETTRDEQGVSLLLSKTPNVAEANQGAVRFEVSPDGSLMAPEPTDG